MKRLMWSTISTASALLMSAFVMPRDAKAASTAVEVEAQDVAGDAKADEKAPDPIPRQFLLQVRPLFRAELHFVTTLCGLTSEQRNAFAKETDAMIPEVTKDFARWQQAVNGGRDFGSILDARVMVQAAMLDLVKARLAPEQAGRYMAEIDKRAADRKQATIRNIVAQMDIDLTLTADQRDQIAGSLSNHWDDAWGRSLELFVYGPTFLPSIPPRLTDPFLDDAQKSLLKQVRRGQSNFFFATPVGFLGNMVSDLDFEGEAPAPGGVMTQGPSTTEPAVGKAETAKLDESKKGGSKPTAGAKKAEVKATDPKPDKKD